MMHLVQLTTICSCLLIQVSARAALVQLPREAATKLETSPLPMPAGSSDLDAKEITTTSTATLNAVSTATSRTTSTTIRAAPTGPRNHNIAVGQNGTQFTPASLKNITIGDTLTFYFYPRNFSVIQSTFTAPCQPLPNDGIHSGFHPTEDNNGIAREKFMLTVSTAETLWFYAVDGVLMADGVMNVCEKGMAMVLNPLPKDEAGTMTLGTYKRTAADLQVNGSKNHTTLVPDAIRGGTVRALTEKERALWDSKHPVGGNVNITAAHVTATGGSAKTSGSSVATFKNNAAVTDTWNSLMILAILVGTSIFCA